MKIFAHSNNGYDIFLSCTTKINAAVNNDNNKRHTKIECFFQKKRKYNKSMHKFCLYCYLDHGVSTRNPDVRIDVTEREREREREAFLGTQTQGIMRTIILLLIPRYCVHIQPNVIHKVLTFSCFLCAAVENSKCD